MNDDEAIRHPKRGKAHRRGAIPNTTACTRWAKRMTERIPVSQTDPEDRCTPCWVGTKWERRILSDEDVRREQGCPHCGAELGELCLDLEGNPTEGGVHLRRRDLAERP